MSKKRKMKRIVRKNTINHIEVEKNIEIPDLNLGQPPKYPWRQMGIGDSFLWPRDYSREEMWRASNAGRNWAKHSKDCTQYKFTCRKTEEGKIRIWRFQ